MTGRSRDDSGFLLVEVLVSLAILAIALAAMAPVFVIASKQNARAGDYTFAAGAAQQKSEQLRRVPYASLASGQDTVTLRSLVYDRVWTVANDTPQPGMKTVTVTVTPRRASGLGPNASASVLGYRVP